MTGDEYTEKMDEILAGVHPTLAKVLRSVAYDDAHAWGYEEIINKVRGFVGDFKEVNDLLISGKR